jgi:hypothetical protein
LEGEKENNIRKKREERTTSTQNMQYMKKNIKKSIFHSRFKVRVIQGPEFGQLGWHSDFEGP